MIDISINIVILEYCFKYLNKLLEDLFHQHDCNNYEINILFNTKSEYFEKKLRDFNKLEKLHLYNYYPLKGFCENHNYLINKSEGKYILILNPDFRLKNDFLYEAIKYLNIDKVGALSPLLYRMYDSNTLFEDVCDTAGMHLQPTFRHLDIYSNKTIKQSLCNQYVWGVSGAAFFIKREILEKIKLENGDYFDSRYYMGREDADLSFRLNSAGYNCLFIPSSIGFHIRTSLPSNRMKQNKKYNYHQVKNRYLLMFNNLSFPCFIVILPFIIIREISIISYMLLFERSSFKAYLWILNHFSEIIDKRKEIFAKRKQSLIDELSWYFIKYKKYTL